MALPASDNFNRSNENLATSSNWTHNFGSEGAVNHVFSNSVRSDTNNQWACSYWSADAFGSEHYSEFDVTTVSDSGGPAVRNGSGDCYYLDDFGANIAIVQFNSGSFDSIDSVSGNYTASSTYKLEATDDGGGVTRLKAYEDGTAITNLEGTDSSLTGGAAGLFIYDNNMRADNWAGDDVAAAASGAGQVVSLLHRNQLRHILNR